MTKNQYKRERLQNSVIEVGILETELEKSREQLEQQKNLYEAVVASWEKDKQNLQTLSALTGLLKKRLVFWKIATAVLVILVVILLFL